MTLQEHLKELRSRFLIVVIFFVISLASSYYFSQELYDFILNPFVNSIKNQQDYRIIFTSPAEAFISYLKLSFIAAIFFTTPILIIQTYLFLAPALYQNEKKIILSILSLSPILFFCGAFFAFYYILPLAFDFFLNFENREIVANSKIAIEMEVRISEYLEFTRKIIFGFGLAFQLPVAMILLIKLNLISVQSLSSKRKYWIVAFFVIGAILTPPDILSQIAMALLMILMFELVIIISKISFKK